MSEGNVEAALPEWAAAIARERERRHFTIDQHRNLYGNDWPAGIARTQSKADDAIDDALAALRSRGSTDTRLTEALRERGYFHDLAIEEIGICDVPDCPICDGTSRFAAMFAAMFAAARADAPQERQP